MLKRFFDVLFSVLLLIILSPIFILVVVWMYLRNEMPVLYVSERMKNVDQSFQLYKFRTMSPPKAAEDNAGVTGGDKQSRVTPLGRILRKYRLDELPQLINIVRGDMSLVGPRPPLRRYTETHRMLYSKVLLSKPGVTGLASMSFHKHEEWLLKQARTQEETERIYMERCIPRKARIDLIYQKESNICFDIKILLQTVAKVLR